MAVKQITDLTPAESFDDGDLLLVRKTGLGVDKNINYANFVRSIGISFVQGYVADTEAESENSIVLKHSSGMALNKYYNGMKISFVSPVTSTDIVQVKIADLDSVALQNLGTKDSTAIKQGQYIEAIYSVNEEGQGVFYCTSSQTNNPQPAAVTKESQNSAQEGSAPIPQPVPTTAPIPVVPSTPEVVVTVGKGGQQLTINEAIAQLERLFSEESKIKATIKLKSGHVIKEYIKIIRKDLSWITLTSEDEEVSFDISVLKDRSGWYGLNFLYIENAKSINLKLKLRGFGSLDSTGLTTPSYLSDIRLIYLTGKSELTINDSRFSNFLCSSIISAYTNLGYNVPHETKVNISNTTFNAVAETVSDGQNNSSTHCLNICGELNMNNCIIDGPFYSGMSLHGSGNINSTTITGNHRYFGKSDYEQCALSLGRIGEQPGNFKLNNVKISGYHTAATFHSFVRSAHLINCNFVGLKKALDNGDSDTYVENSSFETNDKYAEVLELSPDSSFHAVNSTFKNSGSSPSMGIRITKSKARFTNCRLINQPGETIQGLLAYDGAEVVVDGGDYRAADNKSYPQNMVAVNKDSKITLVNSPQGGSSESNGGKIIRG